MKQSTLTKPRSRLWVLLIPFIVAPFILAGSVAFLGSPEKQKLCLAAGVIVKNPVADREFMGRNYQPNCDNSFDYNGQTYRITNSNGDYKRVDK